MPALVGVKLDGSVPVTVTSNDEDWRDLPRDIRKALHGVVELGAEDMDIWNAG